MKISKKILSLLLCAIMLLGSFAIGGDGFANLLETISVKAQAYSTWTINGKSFNYLSFTSASESDCWNYAQQAYNYIWGTSFTNSRSETTNYLRNLSASDLTLTAEHAKEYISNAALGSVIRVCNESYFNGTDSWGHSCILVSKSSTGFTVITGGYQSSSTYSKEVTYTWNSFVSEMGYEYIKYIKWPGGTTAYNTVSAIDNIDLNLSSTTVEVGNSITFTGYSQYATAISIGIDLYDGSVGNFVRKYTETYTKNSFSLNLTMSVAGTYRVYLTASNSLGFKNTDYKSFKVTNPESPVENIELKISNSRIVTGNSITFNGYCENATAISIGIDRYDGSANNFVRQYTNTYTSNSFSQKLTMSVAGTYRVYLTASNSLGFKNTEYKFFYVVDNETPIENIDLNLSNSRIVTGENMKFDGYCENANALSIGIDRYDSSTNSFVRQYTETYISNSFSLNLPISQSGTYRVYLTANNSLGLKNSDYKFFYVVDTETPIENIDLQVSNIQTDIGKETTFKGYCENANAISIGIDLYDHSNGTWNRKYSKTYVSNSFSLSLNLSEVGTYRVYLTASNRLGFKNTDTQTFYIIDPDKMVENIYFNLNDTNVNVGESIKFTGACQNATAISIGIDYYDTETKSWIRNYSNTYESNSFDLTLCFQNSGLYSAYITCSNSFSLENSNRCEFVVSENSIDDNFSNENANIKIANETTLDYRTKVTIVATAENIDTGYHLELTVNGVTYKGSSTEVKSDEFELKGNTTYTVKIVKDDTGAEQTEFTKSSTIKCNSSFFTKLIAFFKGLFGSLPTKKIEP